MSRLVVAGLTAGFVSFASIVHASNFTMFDVFNPLASSVPGGSRPEATPLQLSSSGFLQQTINVNAPAGSPARLGDNWDMLTLNETGIMAGRFLFTPYETTPSGVMRLDLVTGQATTLVNGGFSNGDASRWTPFGTYLTGEESTNGRLFELTNPLTETAASATFVHRNVIPRVAHEGLAFDSAGNMYFVDEFNGGSIYKYTSVTPNVGETYFAAGQTFVLKVGAGGNEDSGAAIIGAATWVAITDVNGAPLPGIPTVTTGGVTSVNGRAAADVAAISGTGYNRPEDLEIQTRADGSQVLYFNATDSNRTYSIGLTSASTANVQVFASRTTLNQASGAAVGNPFTSPDNLAIDADGNIYIVEDQGGGSADIWFGYDSDRDGVAESIGRWASLSTLGAEPTGLYFSPFDPNVAYLNVQHPSSGLDRTLQITAVPEPATGVLLLIGVGLGAVVRRRKTRG